MADIMAFQNLLCKIFILYNSFCMAKARDSKHQMSVARLWQGVFGFHHQDPNNGPQFIRILVALAFVPNAGEGLGGCMKTERRIELLEREVALLKEKLELLEKIKGKEGSFNNPIPIDPPITLPTGSPWWGIIPPTTDGYPYSTKTALLDIQPPLEMTYWAGDKRVWKL